MELKPGYKQTEVGVIPEDWEVQNLGSIARVIGGGAFKSQDAMKTGVRWLKIANVGVNEILWNDESYLPEQFAILSRNFLLKEGDYVLALTRPILSGVLKIAKLSQEDAPALLNQRVGKLESIDGCNLEFLYYLFQKNTTVTAMQQSMAGTDPPNLSTRGLYSIPCIIPPTKAEQEAIAEILSDTDALIESLEQLIAKKHHVKQGAMQELLTGKKRLPGFSGEWEVKRLEDVGEISGSGVDKKSRPDETPVRLVNYMDVYRRAFIFSADLDHWVTAPLHQARRCAVQKGDVFFTPSSETRDDIANSTVAMEDIEDAAYSYHVVRLRLRDPWDLRFRTYAFKTRAFLSQAEILCDGGGTRYVISQRKFRNLTVNVPPLPEQEAIATMLSDIDSEITALENKLAKTRQLKQGMMHNLLTGRIRLI